MKEGLDLRTLLKFIPALLSAFLIVLAKQFAVLAPLAWIALVPFFSGLYYNYGSIRQSWLYCFAFGFIYGLVLPVLNAAVFSFTLLLRALILASGLSFLSLTVPLVQSAVVLPSIAAAGLWLISESLPVLIISGFSGAAAVLPQYPQPFVLPQASPLKTFLLDFILVLCNSLLAEAWVYYRFSKPAFARRYYIPLIRTYESREILNQINRHPRKPYILLCLALAILMITISYFLLSNLIIS